MAQMGPCKMAGRGMQAFEHRGFSPICPRFLSDYLDWCKLIFSTINVSPHQPKMLKEQLRADWALAAILTLK